MLEEFVLLSQVDCFSSVKPKLKACHTSGHLAFSTVNISDQNPRTLERYTQSTVFPECRFPSNILMYATKLQAGISR